MKLLFDQNLSHRLPVRLGDLFPDSAHVRAAGLEQADDRQIWEYAKANGYGIVSQDVDFAERSGAGCTVRRPKSSGCGAAIKLHNRSKRFCAVTSSSSAN